MKEWYNLHKKEQVHGNQKKNVTRSQDQSELRKNRDLMFIIMLEEYNFKRVVGADIFQGGLEGTKLKKWMRWNGDYVPENGFSFLSFRI